MKLNTKTLVTRLNALAIKGKRYFSLLAFLVVACLVGFLVVKINLLSNQEPPQEVIDAKLLEVRRPRVDEKVVKVLQDLEDNNIETQSIFIKARDNPFAESN